MAFDMAFDMAFPHNIVASNLDNRIEEDASTERNNYESEIGSRTNRG